jgi:hypothetical protein
MTRRDDLTAIAGIGEARARQLREKLGIATPADLAGFSADELAERLRAAGISGVTRRAIELWIAQAREAVGTAEEAVEAPTAAEPARPARPANGNGAWRAEASFVVELQSKARDDGRWRTSVHHMEGDVGAEWPGFDCERLCSWLLERAPAGLAPAEAAIEAEAEEPEAAVPAEAAPPPGAPLELELRATVIDANLTRAVARIPLGIPWSIDVGWTLAAPLADDQAGDWLVRASLEPLGPGEPIGSLGEPGRLAARPGEGPGVSYRIDVGPGVAGHQHSGTTYVGVVVLTHEPAAPDRRPSAWFVDLRPIQFNEHGD